MDSPPKKRSVDDLRLARIGLGQAFERLVQVDHVQPLLLEARQDLVQRDAGPVAPALAGVAPPGMFDQHLAHRLDRRGEEMASVGDLRQGLSVEETQQGLVDQALASRVWPRRSRRISPPARPQQLVVDGPDQSILGVGTAGTDLAEDGSQVTPRFVPIVLPRSSVRESA